MITDVLDFEVRGLKTLTTMEAGIDTEASAVVKLAVDYRYDKTSNLVRSDWTQTNIRGGVGIFKTAAEFRLGVLVPKISSGGESPTYSIPDVNLDYILATVQISDRRMIRGAYAQPGGGDASSSNA